MVDGRDTVIGTEAPAVHSEHLFFSRLLAVLVGSGCSEKSPGFEGEQTLARGEECHFRAVVLTVSAVMGTGTWI